MVEKQIRKRLLSILTTMFFLAITLNPFGPVGLAETPPQNPSTSLTVFLPLVMRGGPQPAIMGVETSYIEQNLISKANGVNAYWWRYSAFSWKAIEPNDVDPVDYDWTVVSNQQLSLAASNGFNIVATVKNAPAFAQQIAGAPCGPIKDDAATIAEFVEFVQALVTRYSAAPYYIRTWQLGNEPDVSLISIDPVHWDGIPFGCWGDTNDTAYYGGQYYGKFFKIFSDAVKSVDPSAVVTNGGLLLSCHPVNDASCTAGKFFEGMLKYLSENDGLDALDYVSFHSYTQWFGGLLQDETAGSFAPSGGALLGKSSFLRQVMANYNIVPAKPLLVTEGGLMCSRRHDAPVPLPSGKTCVDPDLIPPPEYNDDQADYVVWLYVRAIADDISGVMWYMLNYHTYRHVGLLYIDGSGKPAYTAYQFMVSQIGDAEFSTKLNQYFPTLRAYEFTKNSQRIWVLWSPDQLDHAINVPAGFQAAYDTLGAAINLAPGATTITINRPIYLILD